jgi:hypothetical protein
MVVKTSARNLESFIFIIILVSINNTFYRQRFLIDNDVGVALRVSY